MYKLILTKPFVKRFNKLSKSNSILKKKIDEVLRIMATGPFARSLRTHKVNSANYDVAWSSRITRDIRLIWDFADSNLIILLLDIGGHSGGGKVYK